MTTTQESPTTTEHRCSKCGLDLSKYGKQTECRSEAACAKRVSAGHGPDNPATLTERAPRATQAAPDAAPVPEKAAAAPTPAPAKPAGLTPQQRADRRKRAQEQAKAVAEWEQAGKKGDRPETPDLDAMNAEHEAKEAAKAADPAAHAVAAPAKTAGRDTFRPAPKPGAAAKKSPAKKAAGARKATAARKEGAA